MKLTQEKQYIYINTFKQKKKGGETQFYRKVWVTKGNSYVNSRERGEFNIKHYFHLGR